MKRCLKCLAPVETGDVCQQCGITPGCEELNSIAQHECTQFFEENKSQKLLFAFSGGGDSVVTLAKLIEQCKKYHIELCTFTIDMGFKGKKTWENIENTLNFFHIRDKHKIIDIRDRVFDNHITNELIGKPVKVFDLYNHCINNNILCCGKICNSVLDTIYTELLQQYSLPYLLTGGDTLKRNEKGEYSIVWNKKPGLTVIRLGAAFGLTKELVIKYIEKHRIPWINPGCGGYDTDCLIPGYFFRKGAEKGIVGSEKICSTYPVVGEYIYERVRFGVIPYSAGSEALNQLDVSSDETYNELQQIINIGQK